MPRRVLKGVVVADGNDKTVTVRVESQVMHKFYKKFVKRSRRYAAHDETNSATRGDVVFIEECRPMSRSKRFRVVPESEIRPQG